MSTNRPRIPNETQTRLLTACRRRCCLCFGLHNDRRVKEGQIAHIDQDPANNAEDNLVWLCLPHHDQRDTRRSQSKGFTIEEVKHYKSALIESLNRVPRIKEPLIHATNTEHENLIDFVTRYYFSAKDDARVLANEILVRFDKYTALGNVRFKEDVICRGEFRTKHKQQILRLPDGLWGPSFECQLKAHESTHLRRTIMKWAIGSLSHQEVEDLHWMLDEEWDMDVNFIFFGFPNAAMRALEHAYLRAEFYRIGSRNYEAD